jgi:DNA-binding transcriptional MerR regulator
MSHYSIGDVCEILKIKPHILRYWEREIELIKPLKDRSGRRVYTFRDIQFLFRLRYLIYTKKYTVQGANEKLLEELEGTNANLKAEIMVQRDNLLNLLSQIREEKKRACSFLLSNNKKMFNPLVIEPDSGPICAAERIEAAKHAFGKLALVTVFESRDEQWNDGIEKKLPAILSAKSEECIPRSWHIFVPKKCSNKIQRELSDIISSSEIDTHFVNYKQRQRPQIGDFFEYFDKEISCDIIAFKQLPKMEFLGAFVTNDSHIGCEGKFLSSKEQGIFQPLGIYLVNRNFFVETLKHTDTSHIRYFSDLFGYTDKSIVYVLK